MADSAKFTDKATELAGQAAAAAGPIAAQAKERATVLAGQAAAAAGPIADQARTKAAQGVGLLAGNLNKLTGGKYGDKIKSVAAKVEGALDTKPVTTTPASSVPVTPTEPVVKPAVSTVDHPEGI